MQSSGNPLQGQKQMTENGRRDLQRGGTSDTALASASPRGWDRTGTGLEHGHPAQVGGELKHVAPVVPYHATPLGQQLFYSGAQM